MDNLLTTLKENWGVIADAPLAFAIWTVVLLSICSLGVRWLKEQQIGNLQSRIDLRDDEIEDLKRKLAGKTDEASQKFSGVEDAINSLRPPTYSEKQMKAFADELSNRGGRLTILTDAGFPEGARLGDQLSESAGLAGWKVSQGNLLGPAFKPPKGITISPVAPGQEDEHEVLRRAFRAAGLDIAISPLPLRGEMAGIEVMLTRPATQPTQK